MRFMVVEKFKPGAATAIYQRARESGRMLPDGLHYVDSWVSSDMHLCFQLMEGEDATLIDEWTRRWVDLIDFEIIPVITSAEASSKVFEQSD